MGAPRSAVVAVDVLRIGSFLVVLCTWLGGDMVNSCCRFDGPALESSFTTVG